MILVVGATGIVGGMVTRGLLEAGKDVRILVRSQADYQPLIDAGATPVQGDLKEPESLAAAAAGIDTVITTATAGGRGGDDTIESVDLHGNFNLIEAAKRTGVRQFIFTSTMGADPASPVPMLRAKGMVEERLRDSGMGYTVLKPNSLMDVWIPMVIGMPVQQGRPVAIIGSGERKHSLVAARDVAALAIAVVGDEAARNQHVVIGGPAAVSWRDIVSVVAAALGRSIEVETLPPGQQLPGLPPIVSEMMAALDSYDSPVDMRETSEAFGVQLTPMEDWVKEHLKTADA